MENRFSKIKLEDIKIIGETIEKEIERRRIQLWFHRTLYYKLDITELSDYDYDKKEYEYKLLRENYPKIKIKGYCPLERVGTDMDRITASIVVYLVKNYVKRKRENL